MDRESLEHVLKALVERGFIQTYGESGEEHFGLNCLFARRHESGRDSTPSMSVSIGDGPSFLICHACGYKGNLLEALNALNMETDGFLSDINEWIRKNEKRTIAFKSKKAKEYKPLDYSEELKKLRRDFPNFPQEAVSFLSEKGCSPEIAKNMQCVWVENEEFRLGEKTVKVEKGFIFPVLSKATGKITCVGAQVRPLSWTGRCKYFTVFPFKAGRHVFGEHLLDKCRGRRLFVTEGPLDCLHFLQHKEASVALLGLNLSKDKAEVIRRGGPRAVYVLLDPDQNTRGTADRLAKKLTEAGLRAYALKTEKDPRSLSRTELRKLVGQSR